MAIKKYTASADNTIVNAYESNLVTRATGSNTGRADIVETFSIYGRQSSSSAELSRILMNFPVSTLIADRAAGNLPAPGGVNFYLKLYAAPSSKTVPADFKLAVVPVSSSWEEGDGLDLEEYRDKVDGNIGSDWIYARKGTQWDVPGGDFLSSPVSAQTFADGTEDLEVNITSLVEDWVDGTIASNGVGVFLSSSYEASSSANPDGATISYYTKRFFARGTQYFFKKPVIEARWNSAIKDDRATFHYSSSLAPAADNLNTIYLYNYIRGKLVNIPEVGTGNIYVRMYSGSADNSAPSGSALLLPAGGGVASAGDAVITGSWLSTGIYSASFAATASSTPLTSLFDVWGNAAGSVEYSTGSITPKTFGTTPSLAQPLYYMNITNLRNRYNATENARMNLYAREKNWQPTVYAKASAQVPALPIPSASYRVFRTIDAQEAVPYGTGSDLHTMLSYDVSGNYFDLDMSLLEPGYEYGIRFSVYDDTISSWSEQEETFRFRVEAYEY